MRGIAGASGDEAWLLGELLSILDEYRPLKRLKGLEGEAAEFAEAKNDLSGRVAAALVAPHARTLRRLAEELLGGICGTEVGGGAARLRRLAGQGGGAARAKARLARRYQKQFRVVMVDEFQDTDALQLQLVEALSDGDLCTVGDEKQSIYRFRGADVDVYKAHRRDMEARGALVAELAVNYRSHPDLLGFVNAVFGSEEYFRGRKRRPAPTRAAGNRGHGLRRDGLRSRVRAWRCSSLTRPMPRDRRAATEAAQVAERVRQLCDAGARAQDVAILMRSYSQAHVYAEALSREGIRAVVVGGQPVLRPAGDCGHARS